MVSINDIKTSVYNSGNININYQMACIVGDFDMVKKICENNAVDIYDSLAVLRLYRSNNIDIVKYIMTLYKTNPRYKPIDLSVLNNKDEKWMPNIRTIFIRCNIDIVKFLFMLNVYDEYPAIIDIIDMPLEDIIIYIVNESIIDGIEKLEFMCNLYKINHRYKPINIHHNNESLFRLTDRHCMLFYLINLYKKDKNYKPINSWTVSEWNDIIFHMRKSNKIKMYMVSLGHMCSNAKQRWLL
jgi:hypothetical protein